MLEALLQAPKDIIPLAALASECAHREPPPRWMSLIAEVLIGGALAIATLMVLIVVAFKIWEGVTLFRERND